MRIPTLLLLLIVLAAPAERAGAQTAAAERSRIASVDVSGLPIDQLSPGLRRDLDALAGSIPDDARMERLARRIEDEHPDVVAAVRLAPREDGQVRVVFLVARIDDDSDLASNINSRYLVESVAISGIPDRDVSRSLRDRLQDLVGSRLDHEAAERLREELEAEQPDYQVERRIARGSERGRIRVVFEFEERDRQRWIPFTPTRSKFVYHGEQGASGVLDIPMGTSHHRALLGFALGNDDDLIEEYSAVRFGVESRRLATQRVGARIEVSWFRNDWRPETLSALAADPVLPAPYRHRVTIDPSVTVALTPHLRVSGGVSLSELESASAEALAGPRPSAAREDGAPGEATTQTANAFVSTVGYRQDWDLGRRRGHQFDASYEFRLGTPTLQSDVDYRRHLGTARYRYDDRASSLIADFRVGRLTGAAPLFERFTLGDTTTLRGWNKFDLAPAGGDRLVHQSLEYRIHHVGFFLDSGSVWKQGDDLRIRVSAGFGLHGDNGFLTLAFPLNASDVGVTFMAGVRF